MKHKELMQQIKAAFASVPAPTEENIVCQECWELRDDLRGRTPDELSDSWVERNFDQLPLLSDDAKQFYLPAFLRVGALKPDSNVSQFVLYDLSENFRREPRGGYSPEQKQAILDYLSFVEPQSEDVLKEYVARARTLWLGH